jgi:hypothetical protein
MKTFRLLGLVILLAGMIIGCQKELSFEGAVLGNPSDGSLQGAGGNCLGSVVAGTYKKDTTLNATNFVTVTVNVNTPGSYDIHTDTVNGISFHATGNFNTVGANTVNLQGIGKPLAAGINTFSVTYDSTQCSFQLTTITSGGGGGGGGAAVFTLDGSPNACMNATAQGTYTAGVATNSSNNEVIHVTVTTAGTYTVTTTAVNGVTFTGSGTFAGPGPQTITLQASGTPTTQGNYQIPVTIGSTNCNFPITVASGSTAAVYALVGQPNACMNYTVQGTYASGSAVTSANTVTVQVNVTTIGSYSMSTMTVNGVSFAASNTFTTAGIQNVVLTATGTPTAAGTFNYPLTAGTSTCTFQITVVGADYYPRTTNSNWTYMFDNVATDTLYRYVIAPTLTVPSGTYNIFMETPDAATPPPDSSGYFRKAGSDYYTWVDAAYYFPLDNPVWGQHIFLKDNQAVGTTWNTVFSGVF